MSSQMPPTVHNCVSLKVSSYCRGVDLVAVHGIKLAIMLFLTHRAVIIEVTQRYGR
jgi:hypothetical protein